MARSQSNLPPEPSKAPQFEFRSAGSLRLNTAPVALIDGVLPRTGWGVMWGKPKSGKTFVMHDMAMSIAAGLPDFHGHRIRRFGPVVYVGLEGALGLERRTIGWMQERLGDSVEPPPFHIMSTQFKFPDHAEALGIAIMGKVGVPVLIVIDTLSAALGGSDSDEELVGRFMKGASHLSERFQCFLSVVHHGGWASEHLRGTSMLQGGLDVELPVRRDRDRNRIELEVAAARDFEEGARLVFATRKVLIGHEDDEPGRDGLVVPGAEITTLVLDKVADDGGPIRAAAKESDLTDGARLALRALRHVTAAGDPADLPGKPPGVRAVRVSEWSTEAKRMGLIGEGDELSIRREFGRARLRLLADEFVQMHDGMVWVGGAS